MLVLGSIILCIILLFATVWCCAIGCVHFQLHLGCSVETDFAFFLVRFGDNVCIGIVEHCCFVYQHIVCCALTLCVILWHWCVGYCGGTQCDPPTPLLKGSFAVVNPRIKYITRDRQSDNPHRDENDGEGFDEDGCDMCFWV